MAKPRDIVFIDNAAIRTRPETYLAVIVKVPLVLRSWQASLFSFEWLHPDGTIKSMDELSAGEQAKRKAVEQKLDQSSAIEKPVLGIGIMDNIEIGIGRAEFLTLAAQNIKTLPIHIPRSNESDFKEFLAGVNS